MSRFPEAEIVHTLCAQSWQAADHSAITFAFPRGLQL
jgi:hypothetical protein